MSNGSEDIFICTKVEFFLLNSILNFSHLVHLTGFLFSNGFEGALFKLQGLFTFKKVNKVAL